MKKIFLSLLLLNLVFLSFAMPGFESYIPDISGEYVFYQDYTFKRESYIGLLTYDEGTYEIRYFAPEDKKKSLKEKSISILITVNPNSNYWEMTGERVIYGISADPEDVDILNYLHDILYEFSARRSKIENLNPDNTERYITRYTTKNDFKKNGFESIQDYPQFGGTVTMLFDCTVPLFNLKSIYAEDGSILFDCVTTGAIHYTEDSSFENFRGIKRQSDLNKTDKIKKSNKKDFVYNDGKTLQLDDNWEQPMENLWTLGDKAMIVVSQISQDENSFLQNSYNFIRYLIQGSEGAYTDFQNVSIVYNLKKNQFQIEMESYSNSGTAIKNLKILSCDNVVSLSVFLDEYSANYDYYKQIMNNNL